MAIKKDDAITRDPTLDVWLKCAQIFALIFVPVAVAAIGWISQHSATQEGVNRDLVQTAIQVLREPSRPDNTQIRQWAVQTVNEHSKVKLSAQAGGELSTSALAMLRSNPLLKPAMEEQLPDCPKIDMKEIPPAQVNAVSQLQILCARNAFHRLWLRTFINLISGQSDPVSSSKDRTEDQAHRSDSTGIAPQVDTSR